MGLRRGPLKLRIEAGGAPELVARALSEGIVLAVEGEEADIVARAPSAEPDVADPSIDAGSPSPRELEILEYLADGWSNAEIASVLGIGVRTVRFHLENLYSRLGVARRGEAVREALRLGLIRMLF